MPLNSRATSIQIAGEGDKRPEGGHFSLDAVHRTWHALVYPRDIVAGGAVRDVGVQKKWCSVDAQVFEPLVT
ncbi:hypothetical protein EMPG_13274 [Blastomyces silverae]|uniref:Uncharacterized protein n=1 Tax=Blastomyces silverae TaxID=2060906 RepID=A0A0H1BK80_9EURO|nr:hypothetical protein EMPG_13274 [Blastomyces silverae]